jgi:hypothetical protein
MTVPITSVLKSSCKLIGPRRIPPLHKMDKVYKRTVTDRQKKPK